jgi:2-oxoglutarate ferredoxin oxidoreductase subunit beta
VARGFSGDKDQLVPLIAAAIRHRGAAFIDVISPCVAFNNHAGSTKSFDYVREHNDAVNAIDWIEGRREITLEQEPGTVEEVTQHDGTVLRIRKLAMEFDPTNKRGALDYLQERQAAGEVVTGLLYLDESAGDLNERMNTVEAPLNVLTDGELCPGPAALAAVNAELR